MDTSMSTEEMVRQITSLPHELGASACFGTPVESEGRLVIPVARVSFGFGLGFGRGTGSNSKPTLDGDSSADTGEGEGGGGGGGGGSTPVAVIDVSAGGVEVEPIIDPTRIALASMTMTAWIGFWVLWTIRTMARERARTRRLELDRASS
jgi:uncharacterized spore protein YtfJ